MSGLEAFSMVCNVMTVISFGLETAKLCRSIHESGSSDPELAKHARRMRESSEQLFQHQLSATTDAEKRLQDVASECLQCTKDIEKEVIYLSPKKPGILRAMKSTIKTIRRRPHLDQLKARLETSRNTMNTVVIGQILEKCVESGKLNAGNFEALIRDQQAFQMAHEQRSQVVENLITQFHDRSKEIVITACKKIEDKIDVVQLRQDADKAYERLLGSLDYDKMNARRSAIPKKHDMTFEWIFAGLDLDDGSISDTESDDSNTHEVTSFTGEADISAKQLRYDFEASRALERQRRADLMGWLRGDSRDLYWISGKPGSGKSTLMKFIAYDKRTKTALRSWRSQPEIISHFLWKSGTDLQKNLRGMLCSLLHQTLVVDEDIGARLLHDRPSLRHRKTIDDWDSDDLKNTLFEAFQATPRSYLVVLDGLDELFKPHVSGLYELLDELIAENDVKLCVSSRPERVFEERFSSGRLLRMQDLTFQDILNYTLATLNSTTLETDDHLKELIVKEIMQKSEGVFIWVYTVLENVKHGISEFNETWHDIYDRITELPSDLMELYRDMWSRLGGSSKKYASQAALYFQLIRYGSKSSSTVACLAVASDDAILDSFTGPEALPHPLKLVERCEYTHKTLHSISSGLLEAPKSFSAMFPVHKEPLDKSSLEGMYYALEKWDNNLHWIDFTHRTALDFLDSEEGITLFGDYERSQDEIFSRQFKAKVLLGCIPYAHSHSTAGICRIFQSFSWYYLSNQPLDETAHYLLDLFRRCADRIPNFYGPPYVSYKDPEYNPPPGFSSDTFFIFVAAYLGFYGYVTEVLQATEDDSDTMAQSALIGACSLPDKYHRDPSSVVTNSRHDLIKLCFQSLSKWGTSPSESTMDAWRCFLRHFLTKANGGMTSKEKKCIENILEFFISAGVLNEYPSSRYLIGVGNSADSGWFISIPNPQTEYGFVCDEVFTDSSTKLYLEVNDSFLLRALSVRISATSEIISQAASLAFMQPILGMNPIRRRSVEMGSFFTCTLSDDEDEDFEEWIFEKFITRKHNHASFPEDVPPYLQVEALGEFLTVFEALEKIEYDLPEVNLHYLCWHDYGAFFD